jgi:hypothetical protein
MPANLVEFLTDQMGPQLVGPVAQLLIVGEDEARKAVHIAIPAVLAGFAQLATTPHGATILSVAAEQTCTIDVEPDKARGPHLLAQNGLEALRSLLGRGMLDSLASALGKIVGLNVRGGLLLVGAVAPATLAYLRQQRSAVDQGARDLAKLFSEQRANITAAVPADIAQLMESSGSKGGSVVTAPAGGIDYDKIARSGGSSVMTVAKRVGATGGQTDGGLSLIQAMGLLVAGVLIVGVSQYMFGSRMPAAVQNSPVITEPAATPLASLTIDNVDLGAELGSGIVRLGQTLVGVTDVASAKAALPALKAISASFNKVDGLVGRLPPSGQARLADLTARAMAILQAETNKACTIPGVADVLKPVLDPLMTSIARLAKKPA